MKIKLFLTILLASTSLVSNAQDNPTSDLVGTWEFVRAYKGDMDFTSKHMFGMVDGKTMKMTLNEDGSLVYEDALVSKLKLTTCSWSVEADDSGKYDLIIVVGFEGGSEKSREEIISIDGDKMVYGSRVKYEYKRVD